MKAAACSLLILLACLAHSQPAEPMVLKGYLVVSCFDEKIKSNCSLDIRTSGSVTGDHMTCGDGNFYKNIAAIKYVSQPDLQKIDNFSYQVALQEAESYVYLSTDSLILLEAGKGDSGILKNAALVSGISKNQLTADLIQQKIDGLHLDFKKKRHYYVLMEVSVKALVLPDRPKPTKFKDPVGLGQYLLLQDGANIIRSARAIKDPF